MNPDLLTVADVMARLQIGRHTVYDLIRSRRLHYASAVAGVSPPPPSTATSTHLPARRTVMPARKKANGEGTILQRADGRWCGSAYVTTTDGTSRRVYVYGTTWREASDKLTAKIADSVRGTAVVAKDPTVTVGQYLTSWLHTVARPRLRPTTFHSYEQTTNRFLIPASAPADSGR